MDETQQMIKDCENRSSKLSEWELSFIDSISNQFQKGLSTMQLQTLDKIWNKVTKI